MALLELRDIHTYYGNIHALKGISITIEPGEIVTLIGANGAGKSTTLKTISGLLRPREGEIWFDGASLDGTPAHDVVAKGISQAPEGRRIFPRMTVRENLEMGAFQRDKGPDMDADFERVYTLFPRLKERLTQVGGTLSGGEQQMLAIGRALMSRPKLVLFDEPSLGLAPTIVERTFDIVSGIRAAGTTVLMVEQNASAALNMCDRAYLLESGALALQGSGRELIDNPHVRAAYLAG